jgi:transcriptional regulator with XRE-family HTH domain
MAGIPKEAGPTAERVAATLRHIRQELGLSYAELARRLDATGHPILDTGLMKIEKGQRRVDVDDLMALAAALGVTPNRLLLPEVDLSRPREPVAITEGLDKVRNDDAWAWAYGERPLGAGPSSQDDDERARDELAEPAPLHPWRFRLARLQQRLDRRDVPWRLGGGREDR